MHLSENIQSIHLCAMKHADINRASTCHHFKTTDSPFDRHTAESFMFNSYATLRYVVYGLKWYFQTR